MNIEQYITEIQHLWPFIMAVVVLAWQIFKLHGMLQSLSQDHTDIKRVLNEFHHHIIDLQREHNQHNEVQAKILQLCEIVERRK